MSVPGFRTVEHTIECQHIREYRRGTASQDDDVLHLAVKQYVPIRQVIKDDQKAVTIIAGHALGIPKEAYEPLWGELLQLSQKNGFTIRGIWIADMSNHGASGVLNEHAQGDDPSYFDHARDLLHMVNTFRAEIRRPIVGVAHSMGGTHLVSLALMHPRLFSSLLLMEPMIQQDVPPGPNAAMPSTLRADLWPSREEAEAAFRKNRFFRALDSRVLDTLLTYSLRPTPTAVYPDAKDSYTLTTSKHQEAWSYLRPNFHPQSHDLGSGDQPSLAERLLHPDADYHWHWAYLFFRPEIGMVFGQLPHLRPPVLYMIGTKSWMGTQDMIDQKLRRTGTGLGGSGGVAAGRVKKHIFEGYGHMFPLEHVAAAAGVLAKQVGVSLGEWRAEEQSLAAHDSLKSDRGGLVVSKTWIENVRKAGTERRPIRQGKAKL